MDLTAAYWDAVLGAARSAGWPEDQLTKLRQRQILRSLAAKAAFTKAAVEVAHNVAALRAFLRDNQRDYAQAGKLPESERDRIEQEVGAYVRSCSANIDTLQQMLSTTGGSAAAGGTQPNANQLAHRQGQVLILSERLRSAAALFDRLRSLRYQQLAAAEAARRRRMPQREPAAPPPPQTSGQHHEAVLRQRAAAAAAAAGERQAAGGPAGAPPAAAQQQIQAENAALQQELMGMNDQVQHAERTVREIATLNQMFSAAITQQSEQIEQLYAEAVAATTNISRANVQLGKAVRTNRSARKYLLVFFLVASLGMLFLDWWNS
ncbi:hypothetical protein ABPG77_007753 [Micractinium sp. CCAP 211/92]